MQELPEKLSVNEILGRKVLIVGDVGTGKTALTVQIFEKLIDLGLENDITIIDMAPKTFFISGKRVGGKLDEYTDLVKKVKYLAPSVVYAPRLTSKSSQELLYLVKENVKNLDPLIDEYIRNPTKILIINDLSIYFHAGDLSKMLQCLSRAETFLANSYYGKTLKNDFNTGVSYRERDLVKKMMRYMDRVIMLRENCFIKVI
ncbi:MAG: helicase HerA domain-containing protein [Candidatus Baldrarchaeia archaeon]